MTKTVVVYTSAHCSYCQEAKKLLNKKGVSYQLVRVDKDPQLREEMLAKSNGLRTVPQIFIGDYHVGGFDKLYDLEQKGILDALLWS
jgi:glutaredoxin 3